MSDLEQELRNAIDALVDPASRARLLKALPSLLKVVASWGGPTRAQDREVFVAVAMPGSCVVFAADVWPAYDEERAGKLKPGRLVRTLCSNLARASPSNDVSSNILAAMTMLLGPEGVARQQRDARRIRSGGGVPLVTALLDREGDNVAMLVTTVTMPRPTVH